MFALMALVLAAGLDSTCVRGSAFDTSGAPAQPEVAIDGTAVAVGVDGLFETAVAAGAHTVAIGAVRVPVTVHAAQCVDVYVVTVRGHVAQVTVVQADDAPRAPSTATLRGQMVDVEVVVDDGVRPIAGAAVFAPGRGKVGTTDAAGRVVVRVEADAPLVVSAPGYFGGSVRPEGARARLSLAPETTTLDDVVVTAPRLNVTLAAQAAERRTSRAVMEVVSADEAKKTGDQNAAQLLRRVAGLSVVGGRYVLVRGLGDRYVSTLVDDVLVPSTDPEKRTVPLDLFPVALLDSVTVKKTWSPDLPAEFGGGAIDVRLKRKVTQRFGQVTLGTGAVLGSTGSVVPMSGGGALDAVGIDTTRAQPDSLVEAQQTGTIARTNPLTKQGYSKDELEQLGEDIKPRWGTAPGLLLPDASAQLAFGDHFAPFGGDLASVAALTWNRSARQQHTERTAFSPGAGGALQAGDRYQIDDVLERGVLGVLSSNTFTGAGHTLTLSAFLQQDADDEVRAATGDVDDTGRRVKLTRLRFIERTLGVLRLGGAHPLAPLPGSAPFVLSWNAAAAVARRAEPDTRELRYDEDVDSPAFLLSDRPDGNQLMTSAMADGTASAKVMLTMPAHTDVLALSDPLGAGQLDVGLVGVVRKRAIDTRRYAFLARGPRATSESTRKRSPEAIFTPENIGAEGFELQETTRPTDNAAAEAGIAAAFATFDIHWTDALTTTFGARVEASHVEVLTYALFSATDEPVRAVLDTVDVLPAFALSFRPALPFGGEDSPLGIKAAVARTVSRPELRELSPAVFTDVAGGRARFGNPDVRASGITHADLRAEWTLSPTDFVAAAMFAKQIDAPIESIVSAGADQAVTVDNVESATNLGAELEVRASGALLNTGMLQPFVAPLYVAGNVALIDSHVVIGKEQAGILTSTERPLAGQSPWLLNLQLGFEDVGTKTTVALAYNAMGPRILDVGALGAPDTIEQPFHQLDLMAGKAFALAHGELSVRARLVNLLDAPVLLTQGAHTVEKSERGRGAALSVSWIF